MQIDVPMQVLYNTKNDAWRANAGPLQYKKWHRRANGGLIQYKKWRMTCLCRSSWRAAEARQRPRGWPASSGTASRWPSSRPSATSTPWRPQSGAWPPASACQAGPSRRWAGGLVCVGSISKLGTCGIFGVYFFLIESAYFLKNHYTVTYFCASSIQKARPQSN